MRLDKVIEGYFLARQNLSKSTIVSYQIHLNQFMEFVGADKDFGAVTSLDVRAYLNRLEQRGLTKSTRLRVWAVLSSLWTWAEKEIDAKHIIRGKVEKPVPEQIQIEPLAFEEVKALLHHAEYAAEWTTQKGRKVRSKRATAKRDKAIILTMVDCGLRASELCGLTIGDYDAKRGRIFIKYAKRNKKRIVYLGKTARSAIWRYMTERPDTREQDPLFATNTNRFLERNNLRHLLERIAEQAQVPNVHPHRFRHTFAVNFLRNGGNVFELQHMLGHERIETLQVYVKLAQTDIEVAQQKASPADNWRL
jgi:integrase/recombinase XerD